MKKKNNNIYLLRFDGASKGNPGKAGAGAVIYLNNKEIWNTSKYIGNNFTCNYAEYYALVIGLEEASKRNINDLYVEGDSQLVINQLKGKFRVKSQNLIDLYARAKLLSNSFEIITFTHIYRTHNQRADELANLLINK
jgi:ribonuclease HI